MITPTQGGGGFHRWLTTPDTGRAKFYFLNRNISESWNKNVKQRGRKSTAALATVTAIPLRMLQPPDDLSAEEASVWARVAATKPSDWWDAGSTPLLAQYARAAVQADQVGELVRTVLQNLATDPDELVRYKELRKIQAALSAEMASLATKMRLTQQSRYNAKNSDTASRKAIGRKPWQPHDVIEG